MSTPPFSMQLQKRQRGDDAAELTTAPAASTTSSSQCHCPSWNALLAYTTGSALIQCAQCKTNITTQPKPPPNIAPPPTAPLVPAASQPKQQKVIPCPSCRASLSYSASFTCIQCPNCKHIINVSNQPAAPTAAPQQQQPTSGGNMTSSQVLEFLRMAEVVGAVDHSTEQLEEEREERAALEAAMRKQRLDLTSQLKQLKLNKMDAERRMKSAQMQNAELFCTIDELREQLKHEQASCEQLRRVQQQDTLGTLQQRYEQTLGLKSHQLSCKDEQKEQPDSLPLSVLKEAMAWHTQVGARLQSVIALEERRAKCDKWTCKVCVEKEIDVQLMPCRHVVVCAGCGEKVAKCPVCRAAVGSRVKLMVG